MFIINLFRQPTIFIPTTLLIILSICLHEYMHAFIAWKCGDKTAVENGHLTLNPLKQMGLVSLFMLALFGFCWGAVPVNWENLPKRSSRALVALAGPLTNLALGVIFFFIMADLYNLQNTALQETAIHVLLIAVRMNLFLFIFNMLPIRGFDGYLAIFDKRNAPQQNSQFRNGLFFLLIFLLLKFNAVGLIFDWCDKLIVYLWTILH